MDKEIEEKFEQLTRKIEEQFRFTRFVIISCGLTMIGVLIFTILTTFQSLPAQLIAHYMSNLEPIVAEWDMIEQHKRRLHEAAVEKQRKENEKKEPPAVPETKPVEGAK